MLKLAQARTIMATITLDDARSCCWIEDEDGVCNTECGHKFIITEGMPAENGMRFCCYCGGALDECAEAIERGEE